MNFRLRRKASTGDVPIAELRYPTLYSNDLVHVIDYASALPGNTIAAVPSIESGTSASGELAVPCPFEQPQLTDERYVNQALGLDEPLWYLYTASRAYRSPSVASKSYQFRVRAGFHDTDSYRVFAAPSDGQMMVRGTTTVTYRATGEGSFSALAAARYLIDHGDGSITVALDDPAVSYDVRITYSLAVCRASITTGGSCRYRIELEHLNSQLPSCLTLRVLSDQRYPMVVAYQYLEDDGATPVDTSETLMAAPLFTLVDERAMDYLAASITTDNDRRYFSATRDGSRTRLRSFPASPLQRYRFRGAGPQTHIALGEPRARNFHTDWYPSVHGSVLVTPSGEVYQTGDGRARLRRRRSLATIVTATSIVVPSQSLVAFRGVDGWEGISVSDQYGTAHQVVSYDETTGIVEVADELSRKDVVTVDYFEHEDSVPVCCCLNPLAAHAGHNYGAPDIAIVFGLLPASAATGAAAVVYAPVEKYTNGRIRSFSHADVEEMFNGTDQAVFRPTIVNLPSGFEGRIEPLATMYVASPIDEDGIEIADARIGGGGFPSFTRDCYDYSLYDGEATDLESYLVVQIDQNLYDDLVDRLLLWDAEVMASSDPQTTAHAKATSLIASRVRKYAMLGTRQEIRIG